MQCASEALCLKLTSFGFRRLPRSGLRLGCGRLLQALSALLAPLAGTFGALLLPRVEFGTLIRCENVADLICLLSAERLTDIARLQHVAAEGGGIALLTGSTGCIDVGLFLSAKRLHLRLVLVADCFDLRLLRLGQVEVGHEIATTSATAEFTTRARTTTISATVGAGLGGCC